MLTYSSAFYVFILSYVSAHVLENEFERTTKCEGFTLFQDLYETSSTADAESEDIESSSEIKIVLCDPNSENFCFALWSNSSGGITVKKKGCIEMRGHCTTGTCISYMKKGNLNFCCCKGDLCNRDLFIEPSAAVDDALLPSDIPKIWVFCIIILFVIICIVVVVVVMIYANRNQWCSCSEKNNQHIQISQIPPSPVTEKLRPIELIETKVKGRFGVVWKAKYKNNFVAVKIISAQYRELWTTEQEIFMLPFMDHENILKFIAAEKHDDVGQSEFWIITEYQNLGSLYDFLKSNILTWEQLCIISFTMARGLAYLHEEIPSEKREYYKPSIAHRDFKSANVLLKSDLSACIADFGLATVFRSQLNTKKHDQIGTKRYMAPEILGATVSFSNNSFLCMDMYSCGLVLWEILTRCSVHKDAEDKFKLPYEAELGEHPSVENLKELVVIKNRRPVLKDLWKTHNLLSYVCEIIEECWDSDPEARLSSACITERFSWHLRSSLKSETKLLYNIV